MLDRPFLLVQVWWRIPLRQLLSKFYVYTNLSFQIFPVSCSKITANLFISLTKSDKATQIWVDWSDKHQSYFIAKIQLFWHKATRNFLMEWIWRLTNYACLCFVSNFALAWGIEAVSFLRYEKRYSRKPDSHNLSEVRTKLWVACHNLIKNIHQFLMEDLH